MRFHALLLRAAAAGVSLIMLNACGEQASEPPPPPGMQSAVPVSPLQAYTAQRLEIYAPVKLAADLDAYSENQKKMLGILIDASKIMDDLYWRQAYGDKQSLLDSISDPAAHEFAVINYGPWDRLNGEKPFVEGVGEKPLGANFYPADMSKEEFDQADLADKASLYTLLRRDDAGQLMTVPYNEAYHAELEQAATLLRQAATLAESDGFANYLTLRAEALLSNDYYPSDIAWMEMKDNPIGLVIGPIETYEDRMYGYKAAFEAYVLLKDMDWSQRLARFVQYLPELQDGLPVPAEYKAEEPGANADLNAYDVIYYAGHSNAGSKTIAINLPNDERVQLQMGTRRLQLKNAMRAKFDKILLPIAGELIAKDQLANITFDAFFKNVMFHEVAHGLGIKNTINGKGTVREALKETAGALEEGKADILGLYMISRLHDRGELTEGTLLDHYVTFLAGIIRSVRFGASEAHAQANMVQFNYFQEHGAFTRDAQTGHYRVNFEAMQKAVEGLAHDMLILQGNGDYAGVKQLLTEKGVIGMQLQDDLDRLSQANIPVDVEFIQGKSVLGLK